VQVDLFSFFKVNIYMKSADKTQNGKTVFTISPFYDFAV